jgi:hypothetical protein
MSVTLVIYQEKALDQDFPLLAGLPTTAEPDTESEEDLTSLDAAAFSQAVVFATDWTAETILRQLDKGNISLARSSTSNRRAKVRDIS